MNLVLLLVPVWSPTKDINLRKNVIVVIDDVDVIAKGLLNCCNPVEVDNTWIDVMEQRILVKPSIAMMDMVDLNKRW